MSADTRLYVTEVLNQDPLDSAGNCAQSSALTYVGGESEKKYVQLGHFAAHATETNATLKGTLLPENLKNKVFLRGALSLLTMQPALRGRWAWLYWQ